MIEHVHTPAGAAQLHRSHGFIYVNDRSAIPFTAKKHKDNDPRRGMPVIICAWFTPQQANPVALIHQSLN